LLAGGKIEKNEMGVTGSTCGEKPEGRDHLEDPDIDGRLILRWIFRKWDVGLWTGSSWLRIWTGGGLL
jgi:hypothetical protein